VADTFRRGFTREPAGRLSMAKKMAILVRPVLRSGRNRLARLERFHEQCRRRPAAAASRRSARYHPAAAGHLRTGFFGPLGIRTRGVLLLFRVWM